MDAMFTGLLLRGGTVLDGLGPPQPDTDVWIVGDRIEAVGPGLEVPPEVEVIDVAGRWVVPGLVDAHVHLIHVPGRPYLSLEDDAEDELIRLHLRAYLACGVTTVLDAATRFDRFHEIQGWITDGAPAPRILSLGRALGPADGYPAMMGPDFPGLSGPEDVAPALDEAVAEGVVGIKVTVERGLSQRSQWPVLDEATRAELRTQAAARSLPLFVHAMTPSDHVDGANLNPRAYVHGPEHPDREAVEAIAKTGAYVVTTLTIYDAGLVPRDEDRLADPLLHLVVPEVELQGALDRDTARSARQDLAELVAPWAPRWVAGSGMLARSIARGKLRRALAAVRDLHQAGVPLVVGTDSGTWPILHTQFHGIAAICEMELLVKAGLSPAEALAAATVVPARMLDLEDQIGTIAAGRVGDLVVLAADPLADIAAFRTPVLTVRAGVARTPTEWMGEP